MFPTSPFSDLDLYINQLMRRTLPKLSTPRRKDSHKYTTFNSPQKDNIVFIKYPSKLNHNLFFYITRIMMITYPKSQKISEPTGAVLGMVSKTKPYA